MKKIITLSLFTALLAWSCGGGKTAPANDSAANGNSTNSNASANNNSSNPATTMDAAQKKIADRRAKGDTLAMPYEQLMKFLPATLDGYKVDEEPTGTSINMAGMSYSNAEVIFTKGNDRVKITLIDYNQAYGLYQGATALWAMGLSVDSPEESAKGVKMDGDIAGWSDYHKKTREEELTLGLGYRFWLQVDADNQDNDEWAMNLAKSMDLNKLATM